MGKNVAELWGREFNIVKDGLSQAQVVSFVNELASEHDMLIQRQEHLSSLTKLAERTVSEAEKLAEETKREAVEHAKAEASEIMAEAEARAQQAERTVSEAEKLAEETKREAVEHAKAEASEIIAEAEARAQQIVEEKQAEIIAMATEQAETIKANAEREAELLLDRQKKEIQPELKAMAQRIYNQLLSGLESLNKQVIAMGEEFERDLSKPTEQTSKIEDKAPLLSNNQAPTTYEEKVELVFLPPIDVLQVVQIDKHLEALPEVRNTEIIPIIDRPVIEVSLCKPLQLVDMLRALPEVSQINEVSQSSEGTDEEFTAVNDVTHAEANQGRLK